MCLGLVFREIIVRNVEIGLKRCRTKEEESSWGLHP